VDLVVAVMGRQLLLPEVMEIRLLPRRHKVMRVVMVLPILLFILAEAVVEQAAVVATLTLTLEQAESGQVAL
jgi:hypothetical protein